MPGEITVDRASIDFTPNDGDADSGGIHNAGRIVGEAAMRNRIGLRDKDINVGHILNWLAEANERGEDPADYINTRLRQYAAAEFELSIRLDGETVASEHGVVREQSSSTIEVLREVWNVWGEQIPTGDAAQLVLTTAGESEVLASKSLTDL